MKRIACALVFICLLATASSAQTKRSTDLDAPDLPLRQPAPNPEGGFASSPGTPAPVPRPVAAMSATVSVSDLSVPAAAKKEWVRFQQSLRSGNMRDCVKHLTKALQIYTQIAAAHQNLAACYVRLNDYEKAVPEFQTASEMDKNMIQPVLGLAGAYLVLGRYGDAELASRKALQINPEDSMGRYLLGRALAFEGQDTPETEDLLRASMAQHPDAHLALANMFLKRNAREQALTELRAYVQQPEVPQKYKETIGCAIEKLSGAPESIRCALVSSTPMAQN
jgi:tetratricopeptide (TPR) repeat protein